MRKCLFVLILVLMMISSVVLLSGCGAAEEGEPAVEAGTAEETADAEILLEESLEEIHLLETPVREYGESYSFYLMEGKLLARILYPVGEIEPMNQALEAWIDQEIAYYTEEAQYLDEGQTAELTVEYESRVVDELVSVKMTGIYDAPFLAHPIDIIKTFNGDLEEGTVLSLKDLTGEDGLVQLQNMTAEDGGVKPESVDEGLLNHWLVTPDGIEITLARGDYLPMSDGTKVMEYTYEELENILKPDVEPEEVTEQKENAETENNNTEETEVPEEEAVPEEPEAEPADLPDPNKPMLALTFDDGPSAHTERLLDAFEEHGGKGTFFVVGNMLKDRTDTLIRMAEEGHEIAGHSWNHRQLTALEPSDLKKQLMSTRAKIYDITGVDPVLARPPYGSFDDEVKAASKKYGIALVNWSVDTQDWKYRDANYVYNSVMKQAKDGAIILCHDLHGTTVDAMERAIPALIDQGYQLVTVSQLLTSQGGEIEAGKVYYKR